MDCASLIARFKEIEKVANCPQIKYFETVGALCAMFNLYWYVVDYSHVVATIRRPLKKVGLLSGYNRNTGLPYYNLELTFYEREAIQLVSCKNTGPNFNHKDIGRIVDLCLKYSHIIFYSEGTPNIFDVRKSTYYMASGKFWTYMDANFNVLMTGSMYSHLYVNKNVSVKRVGNLAIVNDTHVIPNFKSINDCGQLELTNPIDFGEYSESDNIYYLIDSDRILNFKTAQTVWLEKIDKYKISFKKDGEMIFIGESYILVSAHYNYSVYNYNGLYFVMSLDSSYQYKRCIDPIYTEVTLFEYNKHKPLHTKPAIRLEESGDDN